MEKTNTNLNNIMYDENGSFIPFVGHHGNINGEIADYRNTYMEAERDYFSALLKDESIRNYIFDLLTNYDPEGIFEEALRIQEKLETGSLETEEEKTAMLSMTPEEREAFHLNKLSRAEGIMCLLFGAVRDKALVLNEINSWIERLQEVEEASIGSR